LNSIKRYTGKGEVSSMPLIENTVNNFYETNREKQITKSIRDDISIEKKRIRRTRKNRINLSERLKKYDRKWKNIIFLLNIEAVILIIIVISKFSYSRPVEVFAGAFSAYVILLQYFINEQKYRSEERRVGKECRSEWRA